MNLKYKEFKRRRVGRCNICEQVGPLSWDHIPPQGGIELQPVEIDRVVGTFCSTLKLSKVETSADGLKYRNICSACNSFLGTKYDPVLNDFAISLGRFLQTKLELPRIVHLETRPAALARAVLAHLLAARLSEKDAFFDPLIRKLVVDDDCSLPSDPTVFYWVHPFAQQIVMRDCLMPKVRGHAESGFQQFGVLKYFPIGFLVSDASSYEGLNSLSPWATEPSSAVHKIPIDLAGARDAYWPEAPSPGNFLFGGEEMMQSVQAHPAPHLFQQRGPGA